MKLFIVESPTKAKTIQRYLGKGFVVRATFGHIKDLPQKGMGVDEETLNARYVYLRGKKKLLEGLKKLAFKSELVFIGTDPDREGEAIAYFLWEELKKVNPKLKRVVFYEITKQALEEGIKTAGKLNMSMVHSQFARRILDRLIGYKLSPVLWKELGNRRLSVGRVQSPTLRLIVERERQIENFRQKKYYYVKALLEKEGKSFEVVYDYRYENPSDAKLVAERLQSGVFVVSSFKSKEEKVPPPKPFITSSLQNEANSRLGFPVEKTQFLAQKLYERGLITYPRTDSHRINPKKASEFLKRIESKFGKEYVGRLRKFRDSKTSQGAHECIRPTGIKKPEGGEMAQLYNLILNRTLASLMADMVLQRQSLEVEVSSPTLKRPLKLLGKGTKVIFEGWSKAYPVEIKEGELPELEKGDILKVLRVFVEEKKTQPPPRYTEGSLIKTLEKLGIGRPSTYATTIKTLKKRDYIYTHRKALKPTDTAFAVVDFLLDNYPALMDYEFTARMESMLDEIEEGKRDWKGSVREMFSAVVEYAL